MDAPPLWCPGCTAVQRMHEKGWSAYRLTKRRAILADRPAGCLLKAAAVWRGRSRRFAGNGNLVDDGLHHAAHAAVVVAVAAVAAFLLFRKLSDEAFGGEEEAGDGGGVLQSAAGHLGRI